MKAGGLRQRVTVQQRVTGMDEIGQPIDTWQDVGDLYANIGGKSGFSAIDSAAQSGVPASIANYSLMVRFAECQALGVDAGMRIIHDGFVFEVKGITRDFAKRDRAYILCEQGGNNG